MKEWLTKLLLRVSKPYVRTLRNPITGERTYEPYRLDYIRAKKILLKNYYTEFNLLDGVSGIVGFNAYGVSGAYSSGSYYSGGIREEYQSKFLRYEMGEKWGISVDEWFDNSYAEAMKKMEISKLLWDAEMTRKKEHAAEAARNLNSM